ncbi:hypothetical protein AAVH_28237 [Aphelenchoides avenae]|nr:hypothetical protein AAVH_28237 [Aphelenchus avenae]
MLKLCVQCLQPAVTDHVHLRAACKHCGEAHYSALCPLEPWRKGKTCAFCLEYHHSDACKKYPRLKDRLRAVGALKICRRCLSRSHQEDDCTSIHRCVRCDERHHHSLCWKTNKRRRRRIRSVSPLLDGLWSVSPELSRQENYEDAVNVMSDDADEIKIVKVVQGSKSMPPLNEPSKAMTQQSSSQTEHQKQHDKVKVEANETRRALRLTKEASHRADGERDSARKEREAAQDECKALDNETHDLERENRNSEAIRQVIAAAVKASTEIVTNREEERLRTVEQERDDAAKKLLEAENRIEALKTAARDAVRLTVEFQAWRIRAAIKAKKGGISQKELSTNAEDGSTLSEKVVTADQKCEVVLVPPAEDGIPSNYPITDVRHRPKCPCLHGTDDAPCLSQLGHGAAT